jgi:hypothetical protein
MIRGLVVILSLLSSYSVFAAEKSAPRAPSAESNTQHSFEDLLVQGKYHFSDEAVTTVEEDKVLDSLIGVRTDFKDRLQQSSERY